MWKRKVEDPIQREESFRKTAFLTKISTVGLRTGLVRQMAEAWTAFSSCWATRWEVGKGRALWHTCPVQGLLFVGAELLPHIKSQKRLKLRIGFTEQDSLLEVGIFPVWLTHTPGVPSEALEPAFGHPRYCEHERVFTSHKHLVQAGWALGLFQMQNQIQEEKKKTH